MEDILKLALDLGADALHLFLLVPVGCGVEIGQDMMVSAQEYEDILNWLYERSKNVMIDLKATCAPHYFRIRAQRIIDDKKRGVEPQPFIPIGTQLKAGHVDEVTRPKNGHPTGNGKDHGLSAMTKGCLAGTGICFISSRGKVYPCGYLPAEAGDVRVQSFRDVWENSPVFYNLREPDLLLGKCGGCEYKFICEGCRARAYAQTGNYLDEEPFCAYVPDGRKTAREIHEAHVSAEAEMPVTLLSWTREAEARLKNVPFFVRKMVIGKTEAYAQERGITTITPEVLDKAKGTRHGVK
jgi:AdoMet-dependent heme synthase